MLDRVEDELVSVLGAAIILKISKAKYWVTIQNIRVNKGKKVSVVPTLLSLPAAIKKLDEKRITIQFGLVHQYEVKTHDK